MIVQQGNKTCSFLTVLISKNKSQLLTRGNILFPSPQCAALGSGLSSHRSISCWSTEKEPCTNQQSWVRLIISCIGGSERLNR